MKKEKKLTKEYTEVRKKVTNFEEFSSKSIDDGVLVVKEHIAFLSMARRSEG